QRAKGGGSTAGGLSSRFESYGAPGETPGAPSSLSTETCSGTPDSGEAKRTGQRNIGEKFHGRVEPPDLRGYGCGGGLRYEKYLAELPSRLEVFVGGASLVERESGVDDRAELPGPRGAQHRLELGARGHRGADDLDLPPEHPADVECYDGPGSGAVGDESSARGERTDTALPGGLADVLDHDV